MSRRLFVLRPEPGAGATVARAKLLGIAAEAVPLFEVIALPWAMPDEAFDALLLTSANAVRVRGAGLAALRAFPVHAVGEATAEAARAAGFTVASVSDGGVGAVRLPVGARVLHLCGEDHVAVPRVTAVAVYAARSLPVHEALRGLSGHVAAVHSARAGARLRVLVDTLGLRKETIALVAISARAAAAAGRGWEQVAVAARPTDAAVVELAARLCHTMRR